ncbi:Clp protease N-terminal domain-containing protein [Nocardia sp. NPDC052316]|uniref:Clp protease N-terminal domain-containing protein n=1 Tax=Nocardia sp. NPDC052316 TaxID=3364329 RepID=UPI0037CC6408
MFERFTKSARMAVVSAQEDARALRSSSIEVQHVLLGLLSQSEDDVRALLADAGITHDSVKSALAKRGKGEPLGEQDAEALRSIGIDLDAVRETLAENFGEDALDRAAPQEERRGLFGWGRGGDFGHIPFTRESKKVLELSLREALARKDKTIETGHLLLAILRAPNQTTFDLLGGSDRIHQLRPKVLALLDRAA